ncbi:hypothetical protein GY45DRAFT_1376112 [Cubamyces sp. BRFM 1775]|nr:hypothetical protein GY45DRAFT_1376112 [Cubamyces sp. BRFM 1775]
MTSVSSVSSVSASVQSSPSVNRTFGRRSTADTSNLPKETIQSPAPVSATPMARVQGVNRPFSAASDNSGATTALGITFEIVSSARHRTTKAYGDAMRAVFTRYNINELLHRDLWEIKHTVLIDDWPWAISDLLQGKSEEVITAMVQAMYTDAKV